MDKIVWLSSRKPEELISDVWANILKIYKSKIIFLFTKKMLQYLFIYHFEIAFYFKN